MKFWVIKNSFFPIGYRGIVLWPFVFMRPTKDEAYNRRLFRHELQHCYQIEQAGIVRFYVRYLWLLFIHGYSKHPDEVEAYQSQNLTKKKKQIAWYITGKINL